MHASEAETCQWHASREDHPAGVTSSAASSHQQARPPSSHHGGLSHPTHILHAPPFYSTLSISCQPTYATIPFGYPVAIALCYACKVAHA